jgi:hypothetical protein
MEFQSRPVAIAKGINLVGYANSKSIRIMLFRQNRPANKACRKNIQHYFLNGLLFRSEPALSACPKTGKYMVEPLREHLRQPLKWIVNVLSREQRRYGFADIFIFQE